MIREAIFKLVDKQDLTYDEAYDVINEIMSGETTQVQTAAFLFRPFHEVDQERNYRGNCRLRCRHAQSRYQG